jgi:hypothetical protein
MYNKIIIKVNIMAKRENEFPPSVKEMIKNKGGYCCARPTCRRPVLEKLLPSESKPAGCGEGAHIYSASKNKNVRPIPDGVEDSFLISESNGLLLCANCHSFVDYDPNGKIFTAKILFSYKEEMETIVKKFLKSVKKSNYKDLNKDEIVALENKIYESRRNFDYNNPDSEEEAVVNHLFNAAYQLKGTLTHQEFVDLHLLNEITLEPSQYSFGILDDELKQHVGPVILKPYRIRNLMIVSKQNKEFRLILNKSKMKKNGDMYICKKSLFDENNELFNLITLSYAVEMVNMEVRSINININVDIDILKKNKINLKNTTDFIETRKKIETLLTDDIEIRMQCFEDEDYLVLNEYSKPNINNYGPLHYLYFLSMLQYFAKEYNSNIYIDDDFDKKYQHLLSSAQFYYNLIVLNETSNDFKLLLIKDGKDDVEFVSKNMKFTFYIDKFEVTIYLNDFEFMLTPNYLECHKTDKSKLSTKIKKL